MLTELWPVLQQAYNLCLLTYAPVLIQVVPVWVYCRRKPQTGFLWCGVLFYDKPIAWAFFTCTHVLTDPLTFSYGPVPDCSIFFFPGQTVGSPWIASPREEIVWSCLGTVACSCSIYLFMKVGIKCLLGPFHSTHLCPCRFQFSCGCDPD